MLYLETAELPIEDVLSVRRLLYLHTILQRHMSELTRNVYKAMKDDPCKGDWIHMIKEDLESIGMSIESEDKITEMTKEDFKKLVKNKVRENAFNKLQGIKKGHKKVKDIVHTNLSQPQDYITSSILDNKEKALLYNLRSHSVNEYKANFSHM